MGLRTTHQDIWTQIGETKKGSHFLILDAPQFAFAWLLTELSDQVPSPKHRLGSPGVALKELFLIETSSIRRTKRATRRDR